MIDILLRYNLHYKAFEIAKNLHLRPKLKAKIFVHWACCKIERAENITEQQLFEIISQKCEDQPHVSFTEIAHRAIECGKSDLALNLIEQEPAIQKRVPLLLWMANNEADQDKVYQYFDRAINQAIRSKDTNLIHLGIMKLLRSALDKKLIYALIQENTILESHLYEYLKIFDETGLQDYLQTIRDNTKSGMFAIQSASQQYRIDKRQKLIEIASKFLKQDSGDPFYAQTLDQENLISNECLKKSLLVDNSKYNRGVSEIEALSVNNLIDNLIRLDKIKEAKELKNTAQISDKSFYIKQIKIMIEQEQYSELLNFIQQINKRKILIPYEVVSHLLIEKQQIDHACEILFKIPDQERQISILLRMGEGILFIL